MDSSIQNNILDNTFNIGTYTDVDSMTITQRIGLLDAKQYERANGIDSFLDIEDSFWLGNRYDLSYLSVIDSSGDISKYIDEDYALASGVRVVVKITDITITDGDGTLVNSFRTRHKASNTNDIQIGEYINVPYNKDDGWCGDDNVCTFRVVSKDEDSIKVVLNGNLLHTFSIGSTSDITTNSIVYEVLLNPFLAGISDLYKYDGNQTFYIGEYLENANYKDVQNKTLQADIGLPVIGEMFSGNDIDVGLMKDAPKLESFTDLNTIENFDSFGSPMYSTMNKIGEFINIIDSKGNIATYWYPTTNDLRIRPAIYLKSDLTFTGGNGTAQSPYILQ